MFVRNAGPAATAPASAASHSCAASGPAFGSAAVATAGGEDRELLRQLFRAAVRAGSSLPIGRPHQHFTVLATLGAMKLVNWHVSRICARGEIATLSFHLPVVSCPLLVVGCWLLVAG